MSTSKATQHSLAEKAWSNLKEGYKKYHSLSLLESEAASD